MPAADRELLELAARALGARFEEVDGEGYGNLHFENGSTVYSWNPLQFSGDALELAVRLSLDVTHWGGSTNVNKSGKGWVHAVEHWGPDGDHLAATRRAITRAAAEIGKQPPTSDIS
ncbi:hypothetical protein AB595_04785 [Massilia sp. WF1]|nr:hypothetical protein AB595_04785 [Massilia sp. WF1]